MIPPQPPLFDVFVMCSPGAPAFAKGFGVLPDKLTFLGRLELPVNVPNMVDYVLGSSYSKWPVVKRPAAADPKIQRWQRNSGKLVT